MKHAVEEPWCRLDPRLPDFPEPLPNLRRLALEIEETDDRLQFTETDPATGCVLAYWTKRKVRPGDEAA